MLYLSDSEVHIVESALQLYISMQKDQGPDTVDEVRVTERLLKRVNWQDLGWTEELEDAAEAEGWCISDTGGLLQLQRLDERERFADDMEAIGYVVAQAEMGSELHGIALGVTLSPKWRGKDPVPGRPRKELTKLLARDTADA